MIRITGCLLAGLLVLLPAEAQQRGASVFPAEQGESVHVPLAGTNEAARTMSMSIQDRRSSDRVPAYDLGELGGVNGSSGNTMRQQAGAFAAAVFRALASQNTIDLHPELDAVLRPPESGSERTSLFDDAKSLYDAATSYRSKRAVIVVDPLSLRCRLRIDLGRLIGGRK